jgi:hypothetical protein
VIYLKTLLGLASAVRILKLEQYRGYRGPCAMRTCIFVKYSICGCACLCPQQEDLKFEASPYYIARPYLRKRKKKTPTGAQ